MFTPSNPRCGGLFHYSPPAARRGERAVAARDSLLSGFPPDKLGGQATSVFSEVNAPVSKWTDRIARLARQAGPGPGRPSLAARLEAFTFRAAPQLAAAGLAMDAAGLESAGAPQLFSRHLREIAPALNDDLLDLYGRCEQVLANRFAFFNIGREFAREIGWEAETLPAWRAELHAFDYALDLALTYRISRQETYARHLRFLIADWIAANPPGPGSGWLRRTLARRIRNWVLASDLARDDWERDPLFFRVVGESLALQAACLRRRVAAGPSESDSLDCARALLLAARFFGQSGGAHLLQEARTALKDEIETRLRPDGGFANAQPADQLAFAATVLDFLLFDSRRDSALEKFLEVKLRPALDFLSALILPEGSLPLFGAEARAPGDTLENSLALAAVLLAEPRYKSLAGGFGILPYLLLGEEGKAAFERLPEPAADSQHACFPESGLYRLSAADGSTLLIRSSPSHPPDLHQDLLTYHLSIRGQQVIVDSGAYRPPGNPEAEYFASLLAHNVLIVDGKGPQAGGDPCTALHPEDRESGRGFTGVRLRNSGFSFLGLAHQRCWFLLDAGVWVVLDRLAGEGQHRAASLLHFFPTFEVEIGGDGAVVRSRSSSLRVIPLGQPPNRIRASKGDHADLPGFYSPDFGVKFAASVLALEWMGLSLPWVGGYLILAGEGGEQPISTLDAGRRTLTISILGRQYVLPLE